jgi:hypothetical protein
MTGFNVDESFPILDDRLRKLPNLDVPGSP